MLSVIIVEIKSVNVIGASGFLHFAELIPEIIRILVF